MRTGASIRGTTRRCRPNGATVPSRVHRLTPPYCVRLYLGQWVPKADLRQFASRFTTSFGSPYCRVVERGATPNSRLQQ